MTTDKPFSNQQSNLNLLLKQQIVKQLKEADEQYEERNCRQTYEECVTIDKKTSRSVTVSKKILLEETENRFNWQDLKVALANTQINESSATENHKILCDHYDLLEQVLEHILQYIECVILENRSVNRLCEILNTFGVSDNLINEEINQQLIRLSEVPDFTILEEVKNKLFISLNGYENIKSLRLKCEQRKHDYQLALKNFKIILEVMNINNHSLKKLKQQFDEVLIHYQHSRCMLDKELPYVIVERSKVLSECLHLLGRDIEQRLENKLHFSKLIKNFQTVMAGNEYVVVKKDIEEDDAL